MVSTLVHSTSTGDVVEDVDTAECLGSQGVISTSSCNVITARATGAWCPYCHPGDDVPISLAWQ